MSISHPVRRPFISHARYERHPGRELPVEGPQVRKERIEQSLTLNRVVTFNTEGGLTLGGEPSITDSAAGTEADDALTSMNRTSTSGMSISHQMRRPFISHARHERHPGRESRVEGPQIRKERIEQSLTVKRVVTSNTEGGLTLGDEPSITDSAAGTEDDALTSMNRTYTSGMFISHQMRRPFISHARHERHPGRESRVEGPQIRKERIEQSLTVKRVVTSNTEGGLTLGDEPSITETDLATGTEDDALTSTSMNHHIIEDENEETSTCSICLEPFWVGETVAWSKSNNNSTIPRNKADGQPCHHVFHRDCIVPWLTNLKHEDCPICRNIILQDHKPKESSLLEDTEDLEALFVIIHGLVVSQVRPASCSFIAGQSTSIDHVSTADCI